MSDALQRNKRIWLTYCSSSEFQAADLQETPINKAY